ncbi:hypothetical protein C7H79_13945 [Nitrosomonas supralitoralis]|uniref:Uncharacterized protein n=2 Tax=Nitrosomonas supralitoralis TaxID=2116706 RepID=A0A2P7NSB3_9PROT|nr:hypothetical protein C7H79_13945 [Nitrosomonas supralitoralis]
MQCLERHRTARKICELRDKAERVKEIDWYGKQYGLDRLVKLKTEINRQWKIMKKERCQELEGA